jgi:MFS family permease
VDGTGGFAARHERVFAGVPAAVLQLTGSAFDAGLVAATLAGTAMVLRIPAGLITDRWPLRALMLTADAVRAAAVGSIAVTAWTGHVSLAQILVVAAGEAAVGVVFGPADFAAVRLVVPVLQRAEAVAATQSRSQLAALLGPFLGGAMFAAHPALPFAADATSYLGSFGCILGVGLGRIRHKTKRPNGFANETLAGLRWLRRQHFPWPAGWWTAVLVATFASVGLILVVLSRDRGASPGEIGAMYSLSAAGGLIGAWAAPALYRHLNGPAILRTAAWLLMRRQPSPCCGRARRTSSGSSERRRSSSSRPRTRRSSVRCRRIAPTIWSAAPRPLPHSSPVPPLLSHPSPPEHLSTRTGPKRRLSPAGCSSPASRSWPRSCRP